jgi:DNA-binding transcriptional LysR family regulator
MIGTTGRWLVPRLLAAQRERFPGIHLRIVEGTNSSLEPRVSSGQLDLAILSRPSDPTAFRVEELFSEELVVVTPSRGDDALPGTSVTLKQLSQIPLLLPMPGTPLRNEIDEACRAAKVTLHALVEMDGIRTLASLAFDRLGPALLPATAISPHLHEEFRGIPVKGLPPRRVTLVLPRYGFPSSPARAVRDLLRDLVSESADLPTGLHSTIKN